MVVLKLVTVGVALMLCGCSLPVGSGEHVLVIGFGVVTVPAVKTNGINVTKTQAIGVTASRQYGIKAGLSSEIIVQVETNVNALVEVSDSVLAPLTVKTQ